MALTPRQRRFAEEYLIDLNATQAAIRAGYSPRTAQEQGSRLLSNAMVSAEVERLQRERSARTELSSDWVVTKLRENVERAMTATPVLDGEGERTGEYRYDGAVANRALELLGKHLGMFRDKVEVSGPGGSVIPIIYIPHNGRDELPAGGKSEGNGEA